MSDELSETCDRARRYARAHPITAATMNVARVRPSIFAPYGFRVTENFHVQLTYSTTRIMECPIAPPFWHAQIIVMEDIGELEFGAAQRAMVAVKDWSAEEISMATEILGEAFAPLIRTASQNVHIHDGLWARHFFTSDMGDYEKTAAN